LGPLVCVAVIEGSSHPKARLLACKECQLCVEKIGLSGIGKRGVLAAAKSLSEEKLQENRNALVDLMVMLVSRMNNDMQRFTRICGSSLSGKARSLIEEHMEKGVNGVSAAAPKSNLAGPSPRRESQSRRSSNLPKAGPRATPPKLPGMRTKPIPGSSPSANGDIDRDAGFQDELPALDLRFGSRTTPNAAASNGIPKPGRNDSLGGIPSSSPTNLSYPSILSSPIGGAEEVSDGAYQREREEKEVEAIAQEEKDSLRSTLFTAASAMDESVELESRGAAASLRARLIKIRERNKSVNGSISAPNSRDSESPTGSTSGVFSTNAEALTSAASEDCRNSMSPESMYGSQVSLEEGLYDSSLRSADYLEGYLHTIRHLLSRTVPLVEEDDEIIESTDVLKSLHAAVSKQSNLAVNLDSIGVSHLREEIKENANEVVETLTRYVPHQLRGGFTALQFSNTYWL